MSTSEAEYMAACSATMATAHIRMLLYDMLYLGTKQWRESTQRLPTTPAILMIDNEATVQIAKMANSPARPVTLNDASILSAKANKTVSTNFTGSLVTINLLIFSPRHNFLAKLIHTSRRFSASYLTTCFLHQLWDLRSDPRG
ncbi:hypothetical protein MHU86_20087 [Fragilaria crotonensis]|nr:hypothetical protein MHU86_20087 [Fragilaria crotonensis]